MTRHDLNVIRSALGHHEAEAQRLSRKLHEARLEMAGLVPGETIIVDSDAVEYLFRSAEFLFDKDESPWRVKASKMKKDGTWANAEKPLYDGWAVKTW